MIYLRDIRSQYTFCTQSNTYRLVMKKETYLSIKNGNIGFRLLLHYCTHV